jgi:acylphosphatase
MSVCKVAHYAGRVQGVGFRYTTRQLAANFAVSGYVRNLPDGKVELVAEGEAAEVDAFLQAVTQRMVNYIDESNITEENGRGHRGFQIRY